MSTADQSLADDPLATVTVEVRGDAACATVHGEIDMSNAQQVLSALLAAARGRTGLTVDISAVDFMDSYSMAGLHQLWQDLTGAGRTLVIVTGRDTAVERALQMSGMDQVLPLQPEVRDGRLP